MLYLYDEDIKKLVLERILDKVNLIWLPLRPAAAALFSNSTTRRSRKVKQIDQMGTKVYARAARSGCQLSLMKEATIGATKVAAELGLIFQPGRCG